MKKISGMIFSIIISYAVYHGDQCFNSDQEETTTRQQDKKQ